MFRVAPLTELFDVVCGLPLLDVVDESFTVNHSSLACTQRTLLFLWMRTVKDLRRGNSSHCMDR